MLQTPHSVVSCSGQSLKVWAGGGTGPKEKFESSNDAAEVPIINSLVLLHSRICGGSGERD